MIFLDEERKATKNGGKRKNRKKKNKNRVQTHFKIAQTK